MNVDVEGRVDVEAGESVRIQTLQTPIECCAPLSGTGLRPDEADATAALFKALADPTRVRIVNLLANAPQPVCVCELNERFDLSQATLSHHLKKLTTAGLLVREQRGTWAYYSLQASSLERLAQVMSRGGSER